MAKSLAGKVALVTGSSRNIGKAIALELASEGADVAVCAHSSKVEVEAVAAEIRKMGQRSVALLGDLAKMDEVRNLVTQAITGLGKVDILVNTPAIRPHQHTLEITESDWDHVIAVNMKCAFFATQAALPGMIERKWGRIFNFSGSVAVTGGGAGGGHLMATKVGIFGLTRSFAVEYAKEGITANTIVPGVFETERAKRWDMGNDKFVEAPSMTRTTPGTNVPVGRRGIPKEIGELVAYLSSDKGAYITGQSIHINGGSVLS